MPKHPRTPYAMLSLFDAGVLISEFSVSWIRGLWLTAFDKSGLFRCQSAFAISFCQRHCVSLCKGTKAAKSAAFCGYLPVFLWRNLVGVSSRRTGCVLNREGLCVKELNLLLQQPQDVSTRYRSVDMTVLAPEPPSLVQTPCAQSREFGLAEFPG